MLIEEWRELIICQMWSKFKGRYWLDIPSPIKINPVWVLKWDEETAVMD